MACNPTSPVSNTSDVTLATRKVLQNAIWKQDDVGSPQLLGRLGLAAHWAGVQLHRAEPGLTLHHAEAQQQHGC